MPTAINSISSSFSNVRTSTIFDESEAHFGFGVSKNEVDETKYTVKAMVDLCKVETGPLTAGLRGGVQYSFAGQSAYLHSRDTYGIFGGYVVDQFVTRSPGAQSVAPFEGYLQSKQLQLGPVKFRLEGSAAVGYGWVDKGATTYHELWAHHDGETDLLARTALASYPGQKKSGFLVTPAVGVKIDLGGYGELGLAYTQTFANGMDELDSKGVMAVWTIPIW